MDEMESRKGRLQTARIGYLEAALRAIERVDPPYNPDPLEQADEAIRMMCEIARGAIDGTWIGGES